MKTYERDYQPRRWKTYVIAAGSPETPDLTEGPELKACNSSSDMARILGNDPNRFYWDWEMVAADLDPSTGSGGIFRLAQDWKDHPAGSLVMKVYDDGLYDDPPTFTWMVEVPPEA